MKRLLYPPHWVLLLVGVELALWRFFPLAVWSAPTRLAGGIIGAAGVALTIWSATLFRRKKTGLKPFSESTALVTEGPYRFTRNPIYLGMTLVLTGVALGLGAASALIAPLAFVIIMHWRFILPEEAHMERAFGESYLALKRRVRRWL